MVQQGFTRLETYLKDMRAQQALHHESVMTRLQAYGLVLKSLHRKQDAVLREQVEIEAQLKTLRDSNVSDAEAIKLRLHELETKRDAISLELQQLDHENQQLHPFFRFMQDPHLQSQFAELEHGSSNSVSSSCRVFYCSLKVYLTAYLMNTKMLADEVLRDSTTQVRGLAVKGLDAVISCACSAVPGGGLIEAVSSIVGTAVMQRHKTDVEKQVLESGHVSSFSLIEAEHLAQLVSLVLTKCFSCQLDQLTDAACKDLARDAVGRITVSLTTALSRLKQVESDEAKSNATSSAPSAAAVSTSTSSSVSASSAATGSAAVSPVAMTVNRLCELFLIAVRLKVNVFKNTTYSLRDPSIDTDQNGWTSDGLFNRSGVAVPVLTLPSVITVQAAAQPAATTASPSSSVSATPSDVGSSCNALALLSTPFDFWQTTIQVQSVYTERAVERCGQALVCWPH